MIRVFMPGKAVNWPFPPTQRKLEQMAREKGKAAHRAIAKTMATAYWHYAFEHFWNAIVQACAQEAAQHTGDKRPVLHLSERDREVLIATLFNPPAPDARLVQEAEQMSKIIFDWRGAFECFWSDMVQTFFGDKVTDFALHALIRQVFENFWHEVAHVAQVTQAAQTRRSMQDRADSSSHSRCGSRRTPRA